MYSQAIKRFVPMAAWLPHYAKSDLPGDVIAGGIVAVMLVPQAMAYAMLAGLPPQVGLYASILPLVAYSALGSSCALAVGPVAIASLMTASALGAVVEAGTVNYVAAALILAALSGFILLAMGIARLGVLVNFLSHPVISGFTSAAALVIGVSQLKHLLGSTCPGAACSPIRSRRSSADWATPIQLRPALVWVRSPVADDAGPTWPRAGAARRPDGHRDAGDQDRAPRRRRDHHVGGLAFRPEWCGRGCHRRTYPRRSAAVGPAGVRRRALGRSIAGGDVDFERRIFGKRVGGQGIGQQKTPEDRRQSGTCRAGNIQHRRCGKRRLSGDRRF